MTTSLHVDRESDSFGVSRLPIADGGWFWLSHDVTAHIHGRVCELRNGARRMRITLSVEGCLTSSDVTKASTDGFGTNEPVSMFDDAELNDALFGSMVAGEVDGLRALLGPPDQAGLGLDLGCGSGRLLAPMLDCGYVIDGLDANVSAARHAAERVSAYPSCRIFVAHAEHWTTPPTYDYCVAALNTLRYLPSRWAFRTHLDNLATAVKPGGRYIFNITVNDRPERPYRGSWNIHHRHRSHTVTWQWHGYDAATGIITERIEIAVDGADTPWLTEYQAQLGITPTELAEILDKHPNWSLETILDRKFRGVPQRAWIPPGTFWFVVRRGGN